MPRAARCCRMRRNSFPRPSPAACLSARSPFSCTRRRLCVHRDDCCVAPAAEAASDPTARRGRVGPMNGRRGKRCGVHPLRFARSDHASILSRRLVVVNDIVGSHAAATYADVPVLHVELSKEHRGCGSIGALVHSWRPTTVRTSQAFVESFCILFFP